MPYGQVRIGAMQCVQGGGAEDGAAQPHFPQALHLTEAANRLLEDIKLGSA